MITGQPNSAILSKKINMDTRIVARLEREAGLPIEAFPTKGIAIVESPKRTDKQGNRLLIQRIAERDGVLITAIPSIIEAISSVVETLFLWEIFSPIGVAELRRALPSDDVGEGYETGFDYVLTDHNRFRPAVTQHTPIPLTEKDIPPKQYELRMSERRQPVANDFVWAFACYHNDSDAVATDLTLFGPRCASIAVIMWGEDHDIATIGVRTEEAYRGQGYGLAVVSAVTQWILDQGAVAWYGAFADNIPSLRIARRLGFALLCQTVGA